MGHGTRLLGIVAAALLGAHTLQAGDLIVTFKNPNPAGPHDTAHTYITFGGGGTGLSGTVNGGGALVLGQSYPMTSLAQGVTLHQFLSGRIYVSYGAGLNANAGNAYNPNFANPSLPDYSTRWDKIEATWNGTAGGANLTAQDFFGIPLQIRSFGGGQPETKLTWKQAAPKVMNDLGALSGYSVNASGHPQGALVVGPAGVPITGLPGQPVIRVISPATVTPTGGNTVYPSLASYIAYLRNNGGQPIPTEISGNNGMVGPNLQVYSFTATIRNAAGTVGGAAVQPGDLALTGTVNSGGGNVPTTIIVHAANFNDYAIYGCNAPYTMAQGPNTNAIAEKALGDYFAGLNFGLIGSTVANPLNPGHTIGSSPSWTWYGNKPNGINQAKMSVRYAFNYAQSQPARYNQYAGYLEQKGDAYGFPYNDRLQSPLAALAVGSTLEITVLKDSGGTSSLAGGVLDLSEEEPGQAQNSNGAHCNVVFYDTLAAWEGATRNTSLRHTYDEAMWPVNTVLTGAWALNGITVQGFAGVPAPNIFVANFGSPFGTGQWLTANGDESITLTPAQPAHAIAFDAASNQLGQAFVRVYDTEGALIGSLDIPVATTRFVGITSGVAIGHVNFSSVLGAQQNTGFDNVRIALFAGAGDADLNQDGVVDGADLGILLGSWGSGAIGDLNCDGIVDGADLGVLLGQWS